MSPGPSAILRAPPLSPGLTIPLCPPTLQAAEGSLGHTPSPEVEEEEERRRRERMAAARRLALRLAGLLGAGTGVALVYIFGESLASPACPVRPPAPAAGATVPHLHSSPPAGSNAVDEHGVKVRGAQW